MGLQQGRPHSSARRMAQTAACPRGTANDHLMTNNPILYYSYTVYMYKCTYTCTKYMYMCYQRFSIKKKFEYIIVTIAFQKEVCTHE